MLGCRVKGSGLRERLQRRHSTWALGSQSSRLALMGSSGFQGLSLSLEDSGSKRVGCPWHLSLFQAGFSGTEEETIAFQMTVGILMLL